MAAAENISEAVDDGKAPFTVLPGLDLFPGFLNWLYGTEKIQSIPELEDQYKMSGFLQFDSATGQPVVGTQLQQEFSDTLGRIQGQEIDPIPNVTVAFWSFRLMISIGLLAVLGGLVLLLVTRGTRIPKPSVLWTSVAVLLPLLPLIANSFGWIFTEMARQPWIVNGVLPTLQGLSPLVGNAAWITVVLYTLLYGALAVVEVGLLLKYIKPGLPEVAAVSVKDEAEPLSFAY
jgi:cytochrome d ubiquinol oxidase subunit I